MTRKEYLEQKNYKPAPPPTEAASFQINTLADYKKARKVMDAYETQSIALVAADFEAFDRNFEACIEDMTYTEADAHEVSDVDQAIGMMRAADWQWASATVKANGMRLPNTDEFLECARNLYEHLLEDPKPRMRSCSAGFVVDLDIVDHMVSITWGHICIDHFDDEFVAK